jgi:hypothetical protein
MKPTVIGICLINVAATMAMLYFANVDRSWGALCIAVIYSPVVNFVFLVLALALLPLLRSASRIASLRRYIVALFVVPIVSTFLIAVCVWFMDLHGC